LDDTPRQASLPASGLTQVKEDIGVAFFKV
jgi:hypothetical protein